jgi:hypothetical protein
MVKETKLKVSRSIQLLLQYKQLKADANQKEGIASADTLTLAGDLAAKAGLVFLRLPQTFQC